MMDKTVDKYPYKKVLYLQWFQAAIANLILFKYMKQKLLNHIYFLISDQGILLKTTSASHLKLAEEEINKFFTAKIEQLQISASSDFYENILEDIREQTEKLKDTRDCPYINLVYSEKLKNSCLAMKKFGYSKPYENWEINQRERRGFCYLIVRPEHRWKQIANNVMALVKKREGNSHKNEVDVSWPVEMSYQNFIWLYLRKQFSSFKKNLEVREKKGECTVVVTFKKEIVEFMDLQKIIGVLESSYSEERPNGNDFSGKRQLNKTVVLTSFELEKITELIYHEYGLPNLVRQIRGKNQKYLLIGPSEEVNLSNFTQEINLTSFQQVDYKFSVTLREDIGRIKDEESILLILHLGRRHDIINYRSINYLMVKYELPLKPNVENALKLRLPSLPRYFYCYEKGKELFLLRKYQTSKLKMTLESESLSNQIFLINSIVLIVQQLHKRQVFVGSNFVDNIFVDGLRIIIEPAEQGSKEEDVSKLILLVREWVKNMKDSEIKKELEKNSDPVQMLPIFDNYLSQNYI